jgi:hypothetical protein
MAAKHRHERKPAFAAPMVWRLARPLGRQYARHRRDKLQPCGLGHGLSSRTSPGRAIKKTGFITSRAASKETTAFRVCCMDDAWKSAPLRRDEALTRQLLDRDDISCSPMLEQVLQQRAPSRTRQSWGLDATKSVQGAIHFKKTPSIVVTTLYASLWLPEGVEASTGMGGGL